jgi:ribosomal protein S27AE
MLGCGGGLCIDDFNESAICSRLHHRAEFYPLLKEFFDKGNKACSVCAIFMAPAHKAFLAIAFGTAVILFCGRQNIETESWEVPI